MYQITADSACDIKQDILAEWNVCYRPLTLKFEGDDTLYADDSIDAPEFYGKMRDGAVAKTQAVNTEAFVSLFEPFLAEGKDILHLGFSSGLSNTYNSARIAAEKLSEKYPDRKIITIDTLQASAGFGLILYLTSKKQKEGATLEEAATYAREIAPITCAWFTVDDLVYLKRGGRISATTAFVGNALGIKPVMHVDNEGHLINRFKVRGRKTAVASLADQYGKLARDLSGGTVFICHGDCIKDVDLLSDLLQERYGASVDLVTYTGPVIGSHSGPGTLALFFLGKER